MKNQEQNVASTRWSSSPPTQWVQPVFLFSLLDTGESVIVPGDQALPERGENVDLL